MTDYTLPLETRDNSLDVVGGKGRSLAILANGGFRVPTGFHVTTAAYRDFVGAHGLQSQIVELARPALVERRASFTAASRDIQALINAHEFSTAISAAISQACAGLGEAQAVAVRSSATAEDLPGLSFAGQQETYLNVTGTDSVLDAVRCCWASLWTTQAISYRHQNGIDQGSVAMAVVVQVMVASEVSGILFTANPATGERAEMIVNASYGLGEAVVGGQVTPDTFILDKATKRVTETVLGPKAQKIVADGTQGVRLEEVPEADQEASSLDDAMLGELASTAIEIEALYGGQPQDIEWAVREGVLHILQSRPITNLPVQPVQADWTLPEPAQFVSRRQIVENMPDPICPLFEELYLTEGLESPRKGKSLMVGGGAMYVTVDGYAYQRFDFPQIIEQAKDLDKPEPVTELEIEAAEREAEEKAELRKRRIAAIGPPAEERERIAAGDVEQFRSDLGVEERAEFDAWWAAEDQDRLATRLTFPKSDNPTYVAFNNTEWNNRQLGEWHDVTRPRLVEVGERWAALDILAASDETLLEGIREMGIEEGYYWSSNASHSFGVAKSTDDQLQCFLRETLPDEQFISGQFLSGIESRTMQANADLFAIAEQVRTSDELTWLILTTPTGFLMDVLRARNDTAGVLADIDAYLATYGHQGYSMDFVVPTQVEDPSALFATLKAMVQDPDYHPSLQEKRAANIRHQKYAAISELLSGMAWWQFRFRLWLARKYNYIREEVAFLFGYTWSTLRPMAFELGQRMVEAGTFQVSEDTFYLVTDELERAIAARASGLALPELGALAAERRALREARSAHHPPGTLPEAASQIDGIAFKETQIRNDESSATMRGFPVSSGRVSAPASVITGPHEFDQMEPGSILVSPLTTPAWTQLFAHAVGLVTDVGSILAHGSIVAREYGIPAVLGVGNGTKRIAHGQLLTIDGDAGTVLIHEDGQRANVDGLAVDGRAG